VCVCVCVGEREEGMCVCERAYIQGSFADAVGSFADSQGSFADTFGSLVDT